MYYNTEINTFNHKISFVMDTQLGHTGLNWSQPTKLDADVMTKHYTPSWGEKLHCSALL